MPASKSTVKSTTGSGGTGALGSTATILSGMNSGGTGQTVSMAWRTRTQPGGGDADLISDVLDFSDMARLSGFATVVPSARLQGAAGFARLVIMVAGCN